MIQLKPTLETIVKRNPETLQNNKYLLLEVWEAQGLRLYPHQREKFLESGKIASPESISRAKRRYITEAKAKGIQPSMIIQDQRKINRHQVKVFAA